MMTQEEYIRQGLDDNAPLKLILCGNTEISGSEKVGVVSVVYATNDRARAETQLRSLMEEHPGRYYMVYSVPLDVDLTELPHHPSIEITQKDMQMDRGIMSLYICVKDMNRAICFYEEFLEQSVTERDQTYSVFDVGGFRFSLFAYETMNETHVYGNNCVPSFHFESLEKLRAKICNKEICFELTRIKQNWVVEIVDSEGNHIEVTAPI